MKRYPLTPAPDSSVSASVKGKVFMRQLYATSAPYLDPAAVSAAAAAAVAAAAAEAASAAATFARAESLVAAAARDFARAADPFPAAAAAAEAAAVAVAAAACARSVARSVARVVISSTQDTLGRGRRRRRKVLRVGQLAVGTYLSSVLTRVWRLRQRLRLDRQLLPRATPRDGLVHQPSLFGQWVRWKRECTCGDGFFTCKCGRRSGQF